MPGYADYLKVDELIALQKPLSEEHDELLFIVVHQVYELWFKQILHELDRLQSRLDQDDAVRAQHGFKRVLTIFKVLVAQLDVLETMTPLEFLSFRDRLESGSGFQSYQFRELEFVLGMKNPKALDRYEAGSERRARLERRLAGRTLWQSFLQFLARRGHNLPESTPENADPSVANPELQQIFIQIYRKDAELTALCERFVDLDEGIQEWRYRHVKMVERTIGWKRGTGGSLGSDYLRTTLFRPLFPDLWAIRSEL